MSALAGIVAARPRRSTWLGVLAVGAAVAWSLAILRTGGDPNILLPLVAVAVILAVGTYPILGLYVVFAAGILFEQFIVVGLDPITVGTHLYQNLSTFTPIPLRLSVADLLMGLTLTSWLAHVATGRAEKPRMGPFGWAVLGYGAIFIVGTAVGIARGGGWDFDAALAEIREPIRMCVIYFLAANLVRQRGQIRVLVVELLFFVGVKALQALVNYADAAQLPYALDSLTAHEDVIFFDAVIALGITMAVLGVRSRLAYFVFALQPLIVIAELIAQRRVAFIALGVVLVVVMVLSTAVRPRRGFALAAIATLVAAAYGAAFWDASGAIAQPIRSVRSVIDPSNVSARDEQSDSWRVIEDANIAFTVRQLPLTGVGVGQEYLLEKKPPPLPYGFTYWRYTTHNALLWLWLKAGPLGGFALWFLVGRVLLVGSALFTRSRDEELRWMAVLPISVIAAQVVFSAVELGLTYARTMIVLGTMLGIGAALVGPLGLEKALSTVRGPAVSRPRTVFRDETG